MTRCWHQCPISPHGSTIVSVIPLFTVTRLAIATRRSNWCNDVSLAYRPDFVPFICQLCPPALACFRKFAKFAPLSHDDIFMNNCLFLFIFNMEIKVHSFPFQPYTWLIRTKHIFLLISDQRHHPFWLVCHLYSVHWQRDLYPQGHFASFTFILLSLFPACLWA